MRPFKIIIQLVVLRLRLGDHFGGGLESPEGRMLGAAPRTDGGHYEVADHDDRSTKRA